MALSLLAGLGDFAGGLSSAVPQGMNLGQEYQANQALSTFGAGLRNLVGGQQGQGAAPQSFQPPPPTQTAPPPSPAPNLFSGGAPQSPPPTPAASMGPRTATGGSTLFGGGGVTPQQGAPQMAQPAPQQPQAPPPPPMQQPQQPQQQPQIGGGQGPMQQGYLTLPQLIQGMIRANPKVSDYQIGLAASKFGLPLLNEQGIAQYRALQGQLGVGRLEQGYERIAQAAEKEGRIAQNQKSNQTYRENLGVYSEKAKAITQRATEAYRELTGKRAKLQAAQATMDKDKIAAATKEYQEALDKYEETNKQLDKEREALKLPDAPKEDNGDGGGEPDAPPSIIYDKNGKAFKYKGSGPRDDKSSYEPM